MAKYDFFISYSSKDEKIAFKIVNAIESTGHTCWIAPRNIPYGTPYARAIMEGIYECDAFIVLITDNSIKSEDVLNEVDNAHASKKRIIPVRLTETLLSRELNYYLSRTQWLVLPSNSPESIIRLLDLGEDPTKPGEQIIYPIKNFSAKNIKKPLIIIGALVVLLSISGVIWWRNNSKSEEAAEEVLATEEFATSVKTSENDSLSNQKDTITQILPQNQAASTAPTMTPPPAPNIKEAPTSSKDKNYEDMIFNADTYYTNGEFEKALPLYIDIATNYDANYEHKVGWMYDQGQGTKKDPSKAKKWCKKAADIGNAEAQIRMSFLLLNAGKPNEAAEYCNMAENNNKLTPNCKYNIGLLYFKGWGVSQDSIKAKKYWTEAAKEGQPQAKDNLEKYFNE